MKFKINNTEWIIREVDKKELELENVLGETDYENLEIRLLKTHKDIKRTLKHELMHVWLWEYGHPQNNEENFTYENVCTMVSCSNDFINEVINRYFSENEVKETIEKDCENDKEEENKELYVIVKKSEEENISPILQLYINKLEAETEFIKLLDPSIIRFPIDSDTTLADLNIVYNCDIGRYRLEKYKLVK